jgi:hypothetical protein
VFDLNVEHPLDEELLVEELEMDAPEDADELDEDLQDVEDAGDLHVNTQHLEHFTCAQGLFLELVCFVAPELDGY